MSDEAWGEFEEAFFRAGEAQSQQPEGVVFDAADLAALGMEAPRAPDFVSVVRERTALVRQRVRERAQDHGGRARRWLLWQFRMLQFRLMVTLFTGAEHALRAVRSYAFHPRRVKRRSWLARASIVVLISSVSSYSAAAVLVASGAL
jgi:hypothetical protein